MTLIKGSLTMSMDAEVAQVVEHGTENAGVASSTLALGIPTVRVSRREWAEVAQW